MSSASADPWTPFQSGINMITEVTTVRTIVAATSFRYGTPCIGRGILFIASSTGHLLAFGQRAKRAVMRCAAWGVPAAGSGAWATLNPLGIADGREPLQIPVGRREDALGYALPAPELGDALGEGAADALALAGLEREPAVDA